MSVRSGTVGQRVIRHDAEGKATGRVRYTGDVELPRLLHARLVRSMHPHARIAQVDTAAAQAVPGVQAVLSCANVADYFPGLRAFDWAAHELEHGPDDEPVGWQELFGRVVRYVGEPVAAVAAESEAAAREAATLVDVDYEPLPATLDVEAAQAPDAPLVHAGAPGNLAGEVAQVVGDVDAALAEAALVLERRFVTSRQKHAQLEPTCCTVEVGADGKLTIWTPTQAPHRVRYSLARLFRLPLTRLRVIAPAIGGAFGKADGLGAEPYAVALALATGRSVRLTYSRREDFVGTESRHPMVVTLRVGFRADGTIAGLRARAAVNAGAYLSHSKAVSAVLVRQLRAPYHVDHADLQARIVYTHTPTSGAFRGYGGPQACFALEHMIDLGARALGVDPLAARERMRVREGEPFGMLQQPIAGDGFGECLARGAAAVDWTARRAAPAVEGTRRRGVGMACTVWGSGTAGRADKIDQSGAIVHLNADGTATVLVAACDLGTGIRTTLAQICADTLGLSLAAIDVAGSDTDVSPFDSGSYASRTLFRMGQAVQAAALAARQALLAFAAGELECDPADLELRDGWVGVRGVSDRGTALEPLLRRALFAGHDVHGYGEAPVNNAPPFAAHFAEVEVDTETGQVRVLRLVATQDVGFAINPTIVEGQIEGGAYQGLGYALLEGLVVDPETGTTVNGSYMDYRLPTAVDAPRVEVILVEAPDPSGPFGAKGVGEPCLIPAAAAVANAILHATGASVTALPMTPERVLAALRAAAPA